MGALEDLRVVELGSSVSAPFCARLFADLGAEVIKVESPEGDASRTYGPFPDGQANSEESGMFHYLNAGKRGVVLDLANADDLAFFHELLAGADVFIDNSDPAEFARLGLDSATLLERPNATRIWWRCRSRRTAAAGRGRNDRVAT